MDMGLFDIFRKKKRETNMHNDNIGDSLETAVVIHGASNSGEGIKAENQYLSEKFGQRGLDWDKKGQSLIGKEDKQYDKLDIELKDGTNKTVYFDITEFFK
jgi:hypothetical protein